MMKADHLPWLYLLAIAVAEFVTGILAMRVGLWLHCAILVSLPIAAVRMRGKPFQPLLLCMTVAPMIRIMSVTLPLIGFPITYWYLIIAVPIFLCVFMLARLLGYGVGDLGLAWPRHSGWLQVVVGLSGFAIGFGESRILTVQQLAPNWHLASILPPIVILVICTGFMEELVFRGLLQRAAFGAFRDDGILLVCLLFAVLHTGYQSPLDVVYVFGIGVMFAMVTRRTGAIFGTSWAHGLANVTLYVLLPLMASHP